MNLSVPVRASVARWSIARLFALLSVVLFGLACSSGATDDEVIGSSSAPATLADTSTYYTVAPVGHTLSTQGAFSVSRVDGASIRCPNGRTASSCSLPSLDLTPAGLVFADVGAANVFGLVGRGAFDASAFHATELWGAPQVASPNGAPYYRVRTNVGGGYTADRLNSTTTILASVLDGVRGYPASTYNPVIVAGPTHTVAGGLALTVNQFWKPITHIRPLGPTDCAVDADCTVSVYPTAPQDPIDCYCPTTCPSTVLNVTYATYNASHWASYCGPSADEPFACTQPSCGPLPATRCAAGTCQLSP